MSKTGRILLCLAVAGASITEAPATVVEDAKLEASDAAAEDLFGNAVATSGDLVVVGAPYDDDNGSDSGAVYLFRRPASDPTGPLTEIAKLTPSDGSGDDRFGSAVAISGSTIVVGAPFDDATNSNSGSAYVFVEPAGGWAESLTESAKLTTSGFTDQMGYSVAISGDTVVLGHSRDAVNGSNSGSAFVFTKPDGGWAGSVTESAKLVPSDGASSDNFGDSVSISGATIAAGAWGDDDLGSRSGAVYAFDEPAGGWSGTVAESAKLLAADGSGGDWLGNQVAIDGDLVVGGALFDSDSGTAYVFEKPDAGWSGIVESSTKLSPSDGDAGDYFGIDLALHDNVVLVGAYIADGAAADSGAAYFFSEPAKGWSGSLTEDEKLIASDGAADDRFGVSVAISPSVAVVGANQTDDAGLGSGSAYLVRMCSANLPVAQNTWEMISLACDPILGNTVKSVFADDLSGSYGNRWILWRRDETNDTYVRLALDDTVEVGRGYWFKTLEADQVVGFQGREAGTECSPSSSLDACYQIPLVGIGDGRQNLQGHPFLTSTPWKDTLVVTSTGTELTLDEAEAQGVISATMHQWNGSAYQAFDGSTPGLEGTLDPMVAMWVNAFEDSGLRIPYVSPASSSSLVTETASLAQTSRPPSHRGSTWYLRLTATSGDLEDPGNVLGELPDSDSGYDPHDIEELPPFSRPFLTVVFPHEGWEQHASAWYTSDYHGPRDDRVWTFEIRSDVSRLVTLTWDLTHFQKNFLRRFELVDGVSGKVIPATAGSHAFFMQSPRHPFLFRQKGQKGKGRSSGRRLGGTGQ